MNSLVCIKGTISTEEKISLSQQRVNHQHLDWIINPYDEYALEEAIRIKEAQGGEITVVSIGGERVEKILRTALAMGADRALWIEDSAAIGDEWTTSFVLAAVAKGANYDLILTGYTTNDGGSAQGGPRLAELLNITHIGTVIKIEIKQGIAYCERDVEGDIEKLEAPLPLLITAQQGLNEPRYPSLPGIMKAKKKPLNQMTLADLGLSKNDVLAKTETIADFLPPAKKQAQLIQGEPEQQVAQLIALLKDEAKVI